MRVSLAPFRRSEMIVSMPDGLATGHRRVFAPSPFPLRHDMCVEECDLTDAREVRSPQIGLCGDLLKKAVFRLDRMIFKFDPK